MKTGIATALSVAGVIAAGAAAFAVNNSVLGSTNADAIGSTTSVLASYAPRATNGSVAANGTPGAVRTVNADATSVGTSTTTYKVGSAGSVVIDTSTGAIVVTGIAPSEGYTSEPSITDPSGTVKVHFVSATQRIEFIARMVDGKVQVQVLNEDRSTTSPPAGGGSATPRSHHDDERNGEHDGEHEDHESEDDD